MMKKVTITIHTENAAFDENSNAEIARILNVVASQLEEGREPRNLRDINGNVVGSFLAETEAES